MKLFLASGLRRSWQVQSCRLRGRIAGPGGRLWPAPQAERSSFLFKRFRMDVHGILYLGVVLSAHMNHWIPGGMFVVFVAPVTYGGNTPTWCLDCAPRRQFPQDSLKYSLLLCPLLAREESRVLFDCADSVNSYPQGFYLYRSVVGVGEGDPDGPADHGFAAHPELPFCLVRCESKVPSGRGKAAHPNPRPRFDLYCHWIFFFAQKTLGASRGKFSFFGFP